MDFDSRRTLGMIVAGMGAFGIVLTLKTSGIAATSVSAKNLESSHRRTTTEEIFNRKQAQPAPNELTHYESTAFRVTYPKTWQVSPQGESSVTIINADNDIGMVIHTEVTVLREDPRIAVPERLDTIVAEAVSVSRYSLAAIDGQSGFRIWYEPTEGQQAIVTFIGYGEQQTAMLTSYYNQLETDEPLVLQIHDSFVNNAFAQAISP